MKVSDVGGRDETVPRASDCVGGDVGRRERIDLVASKGCSKTYCVMVSGAPWLGLANSGEEHASFAWADDCGRRSKDVWRGSVPYPVPQGSLKGNAPTMWGLFGNVETFLARRKSVGVALMVGREACAERRIVLDSMAKSF